MIIKILKGTFITYGHTDHIIGVIWIIRKYAALMNEGKYEGEFNIFGHNEVVNILNTLSNMMLTKKLLKYIGNGITQVCVMEIENRCTGMNIEFFY